MLTKSEMEAIWNGRSIGELKRISKNAKNKKPYRVTARLWHKDYVEDQPVISTVVWAKNGELARNTAYWTLYEKVREHYPESETRPNIDYVLEAING